MGKKRIHELAKELSLTSADLIQKILEWKMLPGVKLVASSGLEDYLVDDISRRLNSPDENQNKNTPQVVRRRKKSADCQMDSDGVEGVLPESDDEPITQETAEVQKAATVVIVRPHKGESATIIATIAPSQIKDSSKTVPGVETPKKVLPDFKKLVPGIPQTVIDVPETARASEPEKTNAAPEVKLPEKVALEASAAVAPTNDEKPVSRKVTRELSDPPAKIIPPPKGFDAAKVVGVKTVWTNTKPTSYGGGSGRPPGGPDNRGGPGGRPPGGPDNRGGPGGRPPGGPDNRGGPGGRPPDNRGGPGGRPPGGPDNRGGADWSSRKPSGSADPLKAAGVRGGFRAPAPADPIPEAEQARRKDKKKKTGPAVAAAGRFDSDDSANDSRSARCRGVVERVDLYSEGDWERVRRRGKNVKKSKIKAEASTPKAIKRRIKVDEVITVSELAHRLSIKAGDIIKKLMSMGVLASLNQALDFDTATLVASDFGYEVEKSAFDEDNILQLEYSSDTPSAPRPPVVTIMGHVDHGKTSLLDYIRKTNIQGGEAGGITQHIGAYHVAAGGRDITFLDTPGHEAFTAMRSRGAQVTDIVILIVAADDGVMPQTREAADHAKAAGVPIIVAINKVDKPSADAERVRREMMEIGLLSEAWGGDTVFVEISAKTGQGVGDLLDMILLQADILELTARANGPARGRIIEARLDKGRGPVATVLVQEGMLKQGDTYVCGVFYGRIRAMLDDQGARISEAGPAIPVEVQGISGVPQAGDEFIVLEDEKQARQVSQHRLLKQRESELTQTSKLTLENLFDNIKAGAIKGLNLIIKTDVQGSLEAIVDAVMKLSTPEMKINIIHQLTGAVSETDIMLASASNALVIAFGVRPPTKVQELADNESIQIRYYDVIYQLIDDIKEAMAGLLDPVKSEKVLGRAVVRAVFVVSKTGTIAGSYILDGKIVRGARARLLRDSVVVHDGRISSLKRVKDDAKEVLSGYECGIGFEHYNDVKIGDHIEAYQVEEKAATVALIDEAVARAVKAAESAERAKAKAAAEEAAE